MNKTVDITGKKFNKLTAIKFAYKKNGRHYWLFRCECGKEKIIMKRNVVCECVKSCGCSREKREYDEKRKAKINGVWREDFFKNNKWSKRLYNIYIMMINRCYNKNNSNYRWYGGKGVIVCDEWKNDFPSFYNWCIKSGYDGTKKRGEQTLDRINPYDGYSPQNCRFITIQEQEKNKRNNINIEFNGEVKNLKEWCDFFGKNYSDVYQKIFYKGVIFSEAILGENV